MLARMNNPLKDFFAKVNTIISDAERNAIGVDIGTSAIKVVEIKKKGGKIILET